MTEQTLNPAPTQARRDDPGAFLEAHYRQIWATQRAALPSPNPCLQVAAIGFSRVDGDWLGVMVTPWFLNLMLLPGGGNLWGDIPAGQRRYLELACGTVHFVADDDPDIGPYQYSSLLAPVTSLADMAAARQVAQDALAAVLTQPLVMAADMPRAAGQATDEAPPPMLSRRGFLRRLSGKR